MYTGQREYFSSSSIHVLPLRRMASAVAHTFQVIVKGHQCHPLTERQAEIFTHPALSRVLYFRKIYRTAIRNWCIKDPTYVTFTAKLRETANGTLKMVILSDLWCKLQITHRKPWHQKPSDSTDSTWPGPSMDVWYIVILVHLIKTPGTISQKGELELGIFFFFSVQYIKIYSHKCSHEEWGKHD